MIMEESEFQLLAPQHWTVEKKRKEWDDELLRFREKQKARIQNIRSSVRRSAASLHERIFFTLRWSNPRLPSTYHKYILDYCHHLIGPDPTVPFAKMSVLEAWNDKLLHSEAYKVCVEIRSLCERLRALVLKRDDVVMKTIAKSIVTTDKMLVMKDVQSHWQMEKKHNTRDNYWNIWHLAATGKDPELSRYLTTHMDINSPDPDCGLTALHYACKRNHFSTMKILLASGADERLAASDGRTALHFAAAYGSREMVLELLAVGATFDAQDKYGYTALQLAQQNNNHAVVQTLMNWTELVPPEEESEDEGENEAIPIEYQVTSDEVFEAMSAPLRVITHRLESISQTSDSLHVDMELRLCQKRSVMCFDEGFIDEGLKSQKRRWLVAKRRQSDDSAGLSVQYLYAIASELAEYLVTYRYYEQAVMVLSDALGYIKLASLVIALLQRKCQLLLYLCDNLATRHENISQLLLSPEVFQTAAVASPKGTSSFPSSASHDNISPPNKPVSEKRLNVTAPSRLQRPSVHFPPLPASLPTLDTSAHSSDVTPAASLEVQIIEIAWNTINACLSLFHTTFATSSVYVEPLELAVLLELAADVKDRQHSTYDAYDYMQHAATIRERILGQADSITVSTMIQLLRLLIHKTITTTKLYKQTSNPTDPGFKTIGLFATEVSRRLDRLAAQDTDAAQRLSADCYKLVALAELIARGEIDLNKLTDGTGKRNSAVLQYRKYSDKDVEFKKQHNFL